jgi:Mrp family chromosome partitioning ATPase
MVVKKSITMAGMMHINVLGVIENMAYITCPDCGKKIKIFGETPLDCLAAMMGANLIDELPMDGKLAALVDQGKLEDYEGDYLSKAVEAIKKL